MNTSDFQNRAEQLRGQIDTVRANFDDLLASYSKLVGAGSDWLTQAREGVQSGLGLSQARDDAQSTLGEDSNNWWIPVALLGGIGIGVAIMSIFFPRTVERTMDQMRDTYDQARTQLSNAASGMQSNLGPSDASATEQRSSFTETR